ncbi:MAG: inorganic phosphate transporter [Saprospiraceae bacterium]|nr:inorganic phosphate transporter [Saprospiraceae bacterium]MBL0025586.1 inorganic phosphate transporter [Saprospiraceae bacterium]
MDLFIIIGVVILAILAVSDLIVGIGNDAVNFLNSAIGSKVAPFRTIMWIATAGIFVGALSSAGMMEIAREGIFNPEYFSLENVMIIFLSVMLTDIFLLDAFNTIGLPTSTTVSIIFELLGASIIVAGYKVMSGNLPLNYLFNIDEPGNTVIGFINWSKTNTIISSIFLSVLIAFFFGTLVMWGSRILFSFHYKKRLKYVGVIWASVAMVALSYFLVYKGLKSTYSTENLTRKELVNYIKSVNPGSSDTLNLELSFVLKDFQTQNISFSKKTNDKTGETEYEVFFGNHDIKSVVIFIKKNIVSFLSIFFIFWLIIFSVLYRYHYNPLKLVVFAGTFSLAMAFAGNDLVNFIGVPLAGWQSVEMFQVANEAAGGSLSAGTYMMSGLKFPIQTPYMYLLLSGLIMVLTLWFSKKARTVTETEVKLGTQNETEEKFSSNALSRTIVHQSMVLFSRFKHIVPLSIQNRINSQFIPVSHPEESEVPAFDLVRASVNLTLASMLIALGTSLKLPLSTTYVTFMVAMGSSLADRAWGRESATYRIAGVINVIVGWFMTAIIAFLTAAVVAIILLNFKLVGLILMLATLLSTILYTNYKHRKSQTRKEISEQVLNSIDLTTDKAFHKTAKKIGESITRIGEAYTAAINGLLNEDATSINKASTIYLDLVVFYSDIKNNLFKAIKKSKLSEKQTAQLYILSNDMMQDILQSLGSIITSIDTHVKNSHKPLFDHQIDTIRNIEIEVISYLINISNSLDMHNYDDINDVRAGKRSIFDNIENALSHQVEGIARKEYGFKNTNIFLDLLLETKDLVAISVRFSKLLHRLAKGQSPLGTR